MQHNRTDRDVPSATSATGAVCVVTLRLRIAVVVERSIWGRGSVENLQPACDWSRFGWWLVTYLHPVRDRTRVQTRADHWSGVVRCSRSCALPESTLRSSPPAWWLLARAVVTEMSIPGSVECERKAV